jgi:glyoxylase-like metal-dependent hydrolase (beta-lactamase superfamily II)
MELAPKEVGEGVYLLTLPLPMRPSHVHVTLARAGDSWVQFDTGMFTAESLDALQRAWAEIGVRETSLRAVCVTHHHPDHFGASATLQERTGAPVFLHPAEAVAAQHYTRKQHSEAALAFFRRHGIPLDRLGYVPAVGEFWAAVYRPATRTEPLADGQELQFDGLCVQVIGTPGHTPGHCVFYLPKQKILVSGDHVLPKITPHIGLFPSGPENPLGDYLASLRKLEDLDVVAVLPAHGPVFSYLRARIQQILSHHEYRLREMLAAVHGRARTAYEVAALAWGFDERAPLQIQFPATFEALAHLEYLRSQGQVERFEKNEQVYYRAIV